MPGAVERRATEPTRRKKGGSEDASNFVVGEVDGGEEGERASGFAGGLQVESFLDAVSAWARLRLQVLRSTCSP